MDHVQSAKRRRDDNQNGIQNTLLIITDTILNCRKSKGQPSFILTTNKIWPSSMILEQSQLKNEDQKGVKNFPQKTPING